MQVRQGYCWRPLQVRTTVVAEIGTFRRSRRRPDHDFRHFAPTLRLWQSPTLAAAVRRPGQPDEPSVPVDLPGPDEGHHHHGRTLTGWSAEWEGMIPSGESSAGSA